MPRLTDVIGQQATTALLARLVARERLPHALLLEGIPGCGRRTTLRALAQTLLCRQPEAGDACGRCDCCQLVAAGTHPDLTELRHEGAEPTIEEVREEVVARVYESALMGGRRVFLLHAVERLRQDSANALLKALEEPPPGTFLLMSTNAARAVLATIRSRAQLLRLQPLSEADLALVLERGGVPQATARERAMRGSGSHHGLWAELEVLPLEELRRLVLEGYSTSAVSHACAALPDRLTAAQEAAGVTLLQEQRRALGHWISALAHSLREDLRASCDGALARTIERVLELQRDLRGNLHPRLVIEALALDQERKP